MSNYETRPSKLCGFCIFHTETCEPLIEKWFVCYVFFNVSENGKANYQNTNNINVKRNSCKSGDSGEFGESADQAIKW